MRVDDATTPTFFDMEQRKVADPAVDAAEPAISFGAFLLLPKQRLLLEGDKPVRLGNRALNILIALVERPGDVIGKDELVARVWPNTFVEEENAAHLAPSAIGQVSRLGVGSVGTAKSLGLGP
jgi:hypothetical protein